MCCLNGFLNLQWRVFLLIVFVLTQSSGTKYNIPFLTSDYNVIMKSSKISNIGSKYIYAKPILMIFTKLMCL